MSNDFEKFLRDHLILVEVDIPKRKPAENPPGEDTAANTADSGSVRRV